MAPLQLTRIDTLAELDAIRPEWERVYAADPSANLFVSWAWLRSLLAVAPGPWQVLVARETGDGQPVAFCPLNGSQLGEHNGSPRELRLGGSPWADYTGLVCQPGLEDQACAAFARGLRRDNSFEDLLLANVIDPRLDRFTEHLAAQGFQVCDVRQMAGPYMALPDSWDVYLRDGLAARTRESLRRRIRQVESLPGYRLTRGQDENLNEHIEVLLTLWQGRWGAKPAAELALLRGLFEGCGARGCLWLGVLWAGETPVAALVAFVDRPRGTFAFSKAGYNPAYARLSPGRVMLAHSIRWAIESGFQVYDFLLGGEDYKCSFGAVDRFARSVTLRRRSLRSLASRVERRLKRWSGIGRSLRTESTR